MKNKPLTPITFIFYSLKFTPYQGSDLDNKDILSKVIAAVTPALINNKAYLVDKHKDRANEGSRELFINYAVIMAKERRIKCSLALLRSGRTPMIKPHEDYKLVPFDKANGSIAEVTHFYIDYSTDKIIICAEFNYHGPRISDIEYYLRFVAKENYWSKATSIEMYMERNLEYVIDSLKNVLSFEIKIRPKKIPEIEQEVRKKYFTGISSFSNLVNPNFIKLEALYQLPGNTSISKATNKSGKNMVLAFLKSFKTRHTEAETFDNFVIKYENSEGQEEIFNLLKGKKELLKEVDLDELRTNSDWYKLIDTDLTEFVDSMR